MGLVKQKEELEQENRLTKKKKEQYKDIERRIGHLQSFMDDAAEQRTAVKNCVGSLNSFILQWLFFSLSALLKGNRNHCVIYVDFTKWGVVLEGGVNCLVVSVLFDDGKTFDKEGDSCRRSTMLTYRAMETEN
jgi:hypothetical protein